MVAFFVPEYRPQLSRCADYNPHAARGTMLLIEAARCLGFGARVVTGYLYNPLRRRRYGVHGRWGDPCMGRHLPSGGAGWIAYDPTNGTVNGANLIRVAVTRDISQGFRRAGSFVGAFDDYLDMTVDVAVISEGPSRGGSA